MNLIYNVTAPTFPCDSLLGSYSLFFSSRRDTVAVFHLAPPGGSMVTALQQRTACLITLVARLSTGRPQKNRNICDTTLYHTETLLPGYLLLNQQTVGSKSLDVTEIKFMCMQYFDSDRLL